MFSDFTLKFLHSDIIGDQKFVFVDQGDIALKGERVRRRLWGVLWGCWFVWFGSE